MIRRAVVLVLCASLPLGHGLAAQKGGPDAELLTLAAVADRLVATRYFAPELLRQAGAASRSMAMPSGVGGDLGIVMAALRSPDARLRAAALRALGRLETPADVPAETAFLTDPDPRVRGEAANAVAESLRNPDAPGFRQHTQQAFQALAMRAPFEPNGAAAAIMFEALGHLRDPSLFPKIEQILVRGTHLLRPRPKDFERRQLGALRGLEALIRRGTGAVRISTETRDRLRQLALPSQAFDDDTGPLVPAVQALAAAGEDDVSTIVRIAGFRCMESPRTRSLPEAARADCGWDVRRLGFQMMEQPSPPLLSTLRRGLGDPSFRVRIEALRVYDRDRSKPASCAVPLSALSDFSPVVVAEAVGLLKAECFEATDAEFQLRELASGLGAPATAEPWHVPLAAFEALARFSPSSARTVAEDLAIGHAIWQVRAAAVRVAARLGDEALVLRFASDTEPNVRAEVLLALQQLGSDQLVPVALDALAARSDYRPSHAVAYAAAKLLGHPDHLAAAFSALTRTLADLNRPGPAGRIDESSRAARVALLDLVGRSGTSDRSVHTMLRSLLTDSDPAVALAAAATLTALTGTAAPAMPRLRAPELGVALSPCVELQLEHGPVTVNLTPEHAPVAVRSFLRLVDAGHYDGLTFHRAFAHAYVQGGSPQASDHAGSETLLRDESGPAHHLRGTVGIAQQGRHAGSMQFFINLVDAPHLDREFTVIGQVGPCRIGDRREDLMMDVVDAMREGDRILAVKRVIGTAR
jgi:cyclophilin family peptidyl-prolyl cis-trans isomerase/HEAT repeat protein